MLADVAIVGGGPAGLSAAHAVLRARPNLKVAVLERAEVRPRGAVVLIPPNGVRAIEAISPDIQTSLSRHHATDHQLRVFSRDGELLRSRDDGTHLVPAVAAESGMTPDSALLLPWHKLQSELAQALPSGVLHTRCSFLCYAQRADGVLAEFLTPTGIMQVSAGLLIGADGGQSLVRKHMLEDGAPKYLGSVIWRAVCPRPADWPVEHGTVTFGQPGQPTALTHTIGNGSMLTWQAFAPWPENQLHVVGGARSAYMQAGEGGKEALEQAGRQRLKRALSAFEGYPKALRDLIASTDPAAITEHGQFCREVDQCQKYAQGRVALTGDAAHLATPMLGQGCSQAMEDALELGRAIGVHGPTPEALAAYEAARLPMSGAVQEASVQMFKDLQGGKMPRTEAEVNWERGFSRRTFQPLRV